MCDPFIKGGKNIPKNNPHLECVVGIEASMYRES